MRNDPVKQLAVVTGGNPESEKAAAILKRCLGKRGPIEFHSPTPGDWRLELIVSDEMEGDAFAIDDTPVGLRIGARTALGLIHGVGKLLRDAEIGEAGFRAGGWRGVSRPALPVRGIYFATHFHNWYHAAPVEEIQRYVEELALWGTNTVCVWFDLHHFNGYSDPEAQAMMARLTAILGAAREIGMKTAAIFLANEAYANSPEALRADWTAGHDGYFREPGGHYHVELCPSKAGAMELLLEWARERLRGFQQVGLDYLCIWPYDQGGCTCAQCTPWGANGYLRCAEPLARLYKANFPQGKVILSTWYFDHFVHGEWSGLANSFVQKPDWVDLLLADDYGDLFPPFLAENGAPGGLPVVGFPEISMYRCLPWGGYGANPLPEHYQAVWDQCARLVVGGFPYSEGIFEDINKAFYAQFYWDPTRRAVDTLREYLRYEFGPEVVDPLCEVIGILERNLPRQANAERIIVENLSGADRAWDLIREVEQKITRERKHGWRWRMVYRRAQIDAELARTGGYLAGDALREAFAEITRLSHAENALETWVRPPVIE